MKLQFQNFKKIKNFTLKLKLLAKVHHFLINYKLFFYTFLINLITNFIIKLLSFPKLINI